MKRACRDLAERFWEKCDRSAADGCWAWTASLFKNGYGKFNVSTGDVVYAHRFAYQLVHGVTLASAQYVCHRCDNPRCINPAHLFLGDAKANSDDMRAKGRARHVNLEGEEHGMSKLTVEAVRTIRAAPKGYGSGRALARRLRVSETTISRVRKGRGWSCANGH
jgi:hypothetical protein